MMAFQCARDGLYATANECLLLLHGAHWLDPTDPNSAATAFVAFNTLTRDQRQVEGYDRTRRCWWVRTLGRRNLWPRGGKETIIIDASLMPVKDDNGNVVFIAGGARYHREESLWAEIARPQEKLAKLDVLKTLFFAVDLGGRVWLGGQPRWRRDCGNFGLVSLPLLMTDRHARMLLLWLKRPARGAAQRSHRVPVANRGRYGIGARLVDVLKSVERRVKQGRFGSGNSAELHHTCFIGDRRYRINYFLWRLLSQ
jgi:hypothetical protein